MTYQVNALNADSALLGQVLANPSDDTARLVLADLLRESDNPDERARGRFLWAGVTTAQFRNDDLIDNPIYYTAGQEIAAVAKAAYPARWLTELGFGAQAFNDGNWGWDCNHDRVTVRVGTSTGVFTRGMLAELSISLTEWYQFAPQVLAMNPLELVVLSDVPGLSIAIGKPKSEWQLTARLKVPPQSIPLMGGTIPSTVSPSPYLMETAAAWRVEEPFPSRAELILGVTKTSISLVETLREEAGNRWPRLPRNRRR